jgi:hypothetical protein
MDGANLNNHKTQSQLLSEQSQKLYELSNRLSEVQKKHFLQLDTLQKEYGILLKKIKAEKRKIEFY